MDTTKTIKKFVILEIALVLAYLILSFLLESSLPPLLQEYLTVQGESEINASDLVALWAGIPILLLYLVSIVGLLITRVWAKNMYLFVVIVGYLVSPFLGPTVEHAYTATLYDAITLIEGGILVLLFFTNSEFNKLSQQDTASGAAA